MSALDQTGSHLLLWVAAFTEDGAMADSLTPGMLSQLEALASEGLLTQGASIGDIHVFHATAAGVAALGHSVQ